MQELNEIRLIDCIAEVTNKQIAMREDIYVYLDTKEDVEAPVLAEAETLKATKEIEESAKAVKYNGEVYTLNGIDYQVPFTSEDGNGVMQVKSAFDLGVTETVIHFTNGTKMSIAATEFIEFATWFVNKRNSFFVGE